MFVSALGCLFHRCGLRPLALLLGSVGMLGACSPTFNWRELRLQGTPLQALMPCKVEIASRPVSLDGGTPVELHMHSCDAGGLTFALSWAELGDATRVPAALAGWRRASLSAIRVDPARVDEPATQWSAGVPGATQVMGLTALGTDPRGQPVQMRALHFVRESKMYQAAIYGPALKDANVTSAFFEGLKLP
ncbi:hypothetical protein [Hydrogenophaga sp. BPS33]|uniref:hypothetical protein n=1 Tax=Hydrogenophaga sp. BPS33 TaxID=2651974 RepID=UPI00131FF40F|nr:hypothetical protein [Hydrogenophaga sp. BPS33]QHE83827.1 hypothetical protein F9K07_02475 [Hydrogenophaga sp. BPS33]